MNIEVKRKEKRTVTVSLGSVSDIPNTTIKGNLKWNEINSFEEACSNLGLNPIEELYGIKDKNTIAYQKLKTIVLAINEGVVLDWKNKNQQKYYCWFEYDELPNHKPEAAKNGVSSSLRFSLVVCDCHYSHAGVGSRVCFVTEEKARYAGEKFLDIYEDYLN